MAGARWVANILVLAAAWTHEQRGWQWQHPLLVLVGCLRVWRWQLQSSRVFGGIGSSPVLPGHILSNERGLTPAAIHVLLGWPGTCFCIRGGRNLFLVVILGRQSLLD